MYMSKKIFLNNWIFTAALFLTVMAPASSQTPAPGLAPGLYTSVIDGAILLSNRSGAQNFSAGQFGYSPSVVAPPVIVPVNPGLRFTPPPSFFQPGATSRSPIGLAPPRYPDEIR
jgi:hypothetical protein